MRKPGRRACSNPDLSAERCGTAERSGTVRSGVGLSGAKWDCAGMQAQKAVELVSFSSGIDDFMARHSRAAHARTTHALAPCSTPTVYFAPLPTPTPRPRPRPRPRPLCRFMFYATHVQPLSGLKPAVKTRAIRCQVCRYVGGTLAVVWAHGCAVTAAEPNSALLTKRGYCLRCQVYAPVDPLVLVAEPIPGEEGRAPPPRPRQTRAGGSGSPHSLYCVPSSLGPSEIKSVDGFRARPPTRAVRLRLCAARLLRSRIARLRGWDALVAERAFAVAERACAAAERGICSGRAGHLQWPTGHLQRPRRHLQRPRGPSEHLQWPRRHLQWPRGHLQRPREHLQRPRGPSGHLQWPRGHLQWPTSCAQRDAIARTRAKPGGMPR